MEAKEFVMHRSIETFVVSEKMDRSVFDISNVIYANSYIRIFQSLKFPLAEDVYDNLRVLLFSPKANTIS